MKTRKKLQPFSDITLSTWISLYTACTASCTFSESTPTFFYVPLAGFEEPFYTVFNHLVRAASNLDAAKNA